MPKIFNKRTIGKITNWWNSVSKEPSSRKANILLDYGDCDPVIFGTEYSQSLLKILYQQTDGKKTILTLTPICQYQIEREWPQPPFVNINLQGSSATERNNWLGYIPIDNPMDIDYEKLIKKYGNVDVNATIQKKGREYYIQLHISDEYKPDTNKIIKTYISHNQKQIQIMEKISCETGKDYVKVNIKKIQDNNQYVFTYGKIIVGTASIKKIDNCLKDNEISELFLHITKFRFDDDSDNKHYSPLFIFVK